MMSYLYSFFLEPLAFAFMQRALVMALVIGVVCAVFSCFLILKGWSLMGDAVSHAVLPGLAIAYVLGIPLMVGAFVAALFCALSSGYLKENSRIKEDAVMGIVFSGMFAFGLVLLTRIETDIHLIHVLFGNILGITIEDFWQSLIVAIISLSILIIKRKDLMLFCFDPTHAHVCALPVKRLHFTLLFILALTVVSSLKAAGIILVIAMLIAPGATAFLLNRSFDRMILTAVFVSIVSCVLGTIISFHIDSATAPLIVLIQAAFFLLAFVYSKIKVPTQEDLAIEN